MSLGPRRVHSCAFIYECGKTRTSGSRKFGDNQLAGFPRIQLTRVNESSRLAPVHVVNSEAMVSIMTNASEDVTRLLVQWSAGDRAALDRLVPFIYDELHRIAQRQFYRERSDNTLQPTALVNELYLRLLKQSGTDWQNRAQFFCVAAKIMRQVLVDHARERNADKRGAGNLKLDLTSIGDLPDKTRSVDLLALDQALERLASFDEQQTRIVEMKFFGGLSIEETAEAIGLSAATVKREWNLAKAWLFIELKKGHAGGKRS